MISMYQLSLKMNNYEKQSQPNPALCSGRVNATNQRILHYTGNIISDTDNTKKKTTKRKSPTEKKQRSTPEKSSDFDHIAANPDIAVDTVSGNDTAKVLDNKSVAYREIEQIDITGSEERIMHVIIIDE